MAATLFARGYKSIQPLCSVSGSAKIFRVQEEEGDDAEKYVAKVVSLIALDAKGRASAQQEVSLLKGLSAHPNLIAYRQSFMEEPGNLYIVMSLADGGDLRCVVTECLTQKKSIPELVIHCWVRQTLSGLEHLHGQGVVHRDLKSSNIFLCQGRRRVRIGDFGISRVLDSTAFATSCVGTPAYMSPELMRNERYDYHVDMWALGCICFELRTLRLPFEAPSLVGLACQVLKGDPVWDRWLGCPQLFNVAQRLLQKEAEARPTAAQLLNEPFLAGNGVSEPPEDVWSSICTPMTSLDTRLGGDGSSSVESSAHLSRAEFVNFLATHQAELLSALQGKSSPELAEAVEASAAQQTSYAARVVARPTAESVL